MHGSSFKKDKSFPSGFTKYTILYKKTEGDLSAVLKVVVLKFWPHQPCSWVYHPFDRFGASLNYWLKGFDVMIGFERS